MPSRLVLVVSCVISAPHSSFVAAREVVSWLSARENMARGRDGRAPFKAGGRAGRGLGQRARVADPGGARDRDDDPGGVQNRATDPGGSRDRAADAGGARNRVADPGACDNGRGQRTFLFPDELPKVLDADVDAWALCAKSTGRCIRSAQAWSCRDHGTPRTQQMSGSRMPRTARPTRPLKKLLHTEAAYELTGQPGPPRDGPVDSATSSAGRRQRMGS